MTVTERRQYWEMIALKMMLMDPVSMSKRFPGVLPPYDRSRTAATNWHYEFERLFNTLGIDSMSNADAWRLAIAMARIRRASCAT